MAIHLLIHVMHVAQTLYGYRCKVTQEQFLQHVKMQLFSLDARLLAFLSWTQKGQDVDLGKLKHVP